MAKAKPAAEPNISPKALFQKLGFKPHSPGQADYLFSRTRFNIPCCGRRWGKSQAAGHRVTLKSFIPDSYNWIVGPTYKLGEKEFRVVWADYEQLNILRYCRKSYAPKQGDMRIQTPWGSVIEVVSAEKQDSLLGEGLSHACMSEAAAHSRSTWEQYIEPALSDLRGTADFPSTPKGYNWYHGLWTLGQVYQANDQPITTALNPLNISQEMAADYKSWQFPSWTNAVRFPDGLKDTEILRVKLVVSKQWFDQEYGAQFTSVAGAIYGDEWDDNLHILPANTYQYQPNWPNYLAFDYGFSNPFVCLDIQIDPATDTCYVWREYYERFLSTQEHAQAILYRENPPNYRVDGMWGDPRGPDEAATISNVLKSYVASTALPWKTGIEEIKRLLKPQPASRTPANPRGEPRPHLYVAAECPNLARQMSQLHIKSTARAQQEVNEFTGDRNIQHKVDDHAADALRYFIGPHYALNLNTHLEEIYGPTYVGTESHDFITLHATRDTAGQLGDTEDAFSLSTLSRVA